MDERGHYTAHLMAFLKREQAYVIYNNRCDQLAVELR